MNENSTPLDEFKRLGEKASYHYADDSTKEWDLASSAKLQALEVFDANPELQPQMRAIAKGFLWGCEMPRLRPETQNGAETQ